ncbi:hypothetical protein ACNVED_03505 [Legionella sp. D16C41]|uniref:hypothetical protein n=1 Tax=Legionella sp. D16C41 TaxID=3402688 RepID=UPI003AF9777A
MPTPPLTPLYDDPLRKQKDEEFEELIEWMKQDTLDKYKKTNVDTPPPLAVKSVKKPEDDKDWADIVVAYKALYPKVDITDNILKFSSPKKADEFFSEQAKNGKIFLVQEMNNGKITDKYQFSFGNGEVYKGTLKDIAQKLKDTEQKLKIDSVQGKGNPAMEAEVKKAIDLIMKKQEQAEKKKLEQANQGANLDNDADKKQDNKSP